MKCEGYVNSCNSSFSLWRGMLSNAILHHGGERLTSEVGSSDAAKSKTMRCTSGGNMSACRNIFHINLRRVQDVEREVLNVLHQCAAAGLRSLAIPAIGTGNLRFSPKEVSEGIRRALERYADNQNRNSSLKTVNIVVFRPNMLADFQNNEL
ncbi:protein mono-ADP-ribosyltransferase PARP15-like [Ciona intestinalis]